MDFRSPLRCVTPTLDADVLLALARADDEFVGRRVHALVGRGSEEGVRRVLKRLATQGVVTERVVGRATTYRLNRDHLAAPWIQGLASMERELVERLAGALRSWVSPPVVAAIFGSAARGEAGPESDIDLFLVRPTAAEEDPWETDLDQTLARVSAWTGNDARALVVDELAPEFAPEPVAQDIVDHGILVHGTRRELRRLLS